MGLATSQIVKKNVLGFDKDKSKTKVVVAMSGGVDSSVVAALLKKQGYEVIGITLQLFDYGKIGKTKGTCCAGKDIYDAKKVCDQLDIKHEVFNYESIFKEEVIEKFADSYVKGETPIPCVDCNQTVKFRDLFKSAKELDADDDELTRTRKVRRNFINEKYKILIDALYSNVDNCNFDTKVTFEDGRTGSLKATVKILDC